MGKKNNLKNQIKAKNNKKVKAKSNNKANHLSQGIRQKRQRRQKIKMNQKQEASIEIENFQQETIQSIFIRWFNSIQQKDLVFSQKTRQKLRRNYPKKIIQNQDLYEVNEQLSKINYVIKGIQNLQDIYNQEQLSIDYIRKTNKKQRFEEQLKLFFQNASFLFPKDVTAQLYNILKKITIIVLDNRQNYQQMVSNLSKLGNELANPSSEEKDYFYFSFKMFKLPSGCNEDGIKKLIKYQPYYRYILKQKYRQQNGPYAQLITEIGELLYSKYNQIFTDQIKAQSRFRQSQQLRFRQGQQLRFRQSQQFQIHRTQLAKKGLI